MPSTLTKRWSQRSKARVHLSPRLGPSLVTRTEFRLLHAATGQARKLQSPQLRIPALR